MGYTYIYMKKGRNYTRIYHLCECICVRERERKRERPFELFKFKTIVYCARELSLEFPVYEGRRKRGQNRSSIRKKIVHALSCYWYDSNNLTSVGRSVDGVHRETTRCVNHEFRIAFSRRVFRCCYRVDVRETGKRGKRRVSRDVEKKG